jgi:putative transposase
LVRVTDTPHGFEFYPNLVLALTLSGPDQLWAAAITYVCLPCEFVYLAVLLDAYSRRGIGCALDGSLEAKLSLAAIHMVLEGRVVRPGLVQRSDRGVQYASRAYTNLLNARGIQISMSRPGNPYDNAQAETFIRTVKHEHVYLCEYQNLAESRRQIGHFIEDVYSKNGSTPPWGINHPLSSSGGPCNDCVLDKLSHSRGFTPPYG